MRKRPHDGTWNGFLHSADQSKRLAGSERICRYSRQNNIEKSATGESARGTIKRRRGGEQNARRRWNRPPWIGGDDRTRRRILRRIWNARIHESDSRSWFWNGPRTGLLGRRRRTRLAKPVLRNRYSRFSVGRQRYAIRDAVCNAVRFCTDQGTGNGHAEGSGGAI